MGVWNKDRELMEREDLDQVILERLQAMLNRTLTNVPFYHDLFARSGVVPEKIRSIRDLSHIPFTTRDDLVEQQPYGFFAVPLRDIARIHTSSGTTGRP
jgi:phenylacetate-CoA ligase